MLKKNLSRHQKVSCPGPAGNIINNENNNNENNNSNNTNNNNNNKVNCPWCHGLKAKSYINKHKQICKERPPIPIPDQSPSPQSESQ